MWNSGKLKLIPGLVTNLYVTLDKPCNLYSCFLHSKMRVLYQKMISKNAMNLYS